jgi:hypothetical protein
MPAGGTAEDRYAAKVARDYAKLIATKGWYEFGFMHAFKGLWSDVPLTGPGFVRKWERRFALSAEYLVKAAYASVIGMGTAAGYAPDELTRHVWRSGGASRSTRRSVGNAHFKRVRDLDRGYSLLTVGRYDPYRDALLALSDHADCVRIAEINGSEVVTIAGTAPSAVAHAGADVGRGGVPPTRRSVADAHAAARAGARSARCAQVTSRRGSVPRGAHLRLLDECPTQSS